MSFPASRAAARQSSASVASPQRNSCRLACRATPGLPSSVVISPRRAASANRLNGRCHARAGVSVPWLGRAREQSARVSLECTPGNAASHAASCFSRGLALRHQLLSVSPPRCSATPAVLLWLAVLAPERRFALARRLPASVAGEREAISRLLARLVHVARTAATLRHGAFKKNRAYRVALDAGAPWGSFSWSTLTSSGSRGKRWRSSRAMPATTSSRKSSRLTPATPPATLSRQI